MVRYYGYYSNKSRGLRKRSSKDNLAPALIDPDLPRKSFNRTWARLIRKIYEVDPLLCQKCQGTMQVIAFIEDSGLVRIILRHLGLWDTRTHDPPSSKANDESSPSEMIYDASYSQIPDTDADLASSGALTLPSGFPRAKSGETVGCMFRMPPFYLSARNHVPTHFPRNPTHTTYSGQPSPNTQLSRLDI